MSRTTLALATAGCLLTLAGCAGTSGPAGSGSLGQLPGTTPGTPATVAPTTAAPATTKPVHTQPPPTHTQPPDWPTNADCVSYNPANLTVDGTAASGTFLVEDGSTIVIRIHSDQDQAGPQALALAQRYTRHCYIGRNNTMDPKGDYIFDYWRDPSGQTPPIPDEDDDDLCSPYNNTNLTVEDMGDGNGWRVKDHDHVLHLFADQQDANDADIVLKKYSSVCAIGDITDSDSDLGQVDYQK